MPSKNGVSVPFTYGYGENNGNCSFRQRFLWKSFHISINDLLYLPGYQLYLAQCIQLMKMALLHYKDVKSDTKNDYCLFFLKFGRNKWADHIFYGLLYFFKNDCILLSFTENSNDKYLRPT